MQYVLKNYPHTPTNPQPHPSLFYQHPTPPHPHTRTIGKRRVAGHIQIIRKYEITYKRKKEWQMEGILMTNHILNIRDSTTGNFCAIFLLKTTKDR